MNSLRLNNIDLYAQQTKTADANAFYQKSGKRLKNSNINSLA